MATRTDLGNMAVFDERTPQVDGCAALHLASADDREAALQAGARAALCALLQGLCALPLPAGDLASSAADGAVRGTALRVGRVALPPPSTPLPRHRGQPVAREPTKWEAFARAKGIRKRSRTERMAYSETRKEWAPRHGKGSERNHMRKATSWISELPRGATSLPDDA